jgi:hypothetical protein
LAYGVKVADGLVHADTAAVTRTLRTTAAKVRTISLHSFAFSE